MPSSIPAIKPIETVWRGYKFRSRLEARWGVCFEHLGLRWEYEPEGFVLPDQSRYLPDFYLPDQDLYVEIKPAINYAPEHIYLAGKFNSSWRAPICAESEYGWRCIDGIKRPIMDGFHFCAGPYRASSNGHGSVIPCTHAEIGYLDGSDIEGNGVFIAESELNAFEIFVKCCDAIRRCTAFFAWIDSLDCYGTLAEIGFAHALGKPIFLGISQDLYARLPNSEIVDNYKPHNTNYHHDLWFVEKMAQQSTVSSTALDAYRRFFPLVAPELKKIQQLPKWMLIAGNPYPGEYVVFQGYGARPYNVGALSTVSPLPWKVKQSVPRITIDQPGHEGGAVVAALAAARSARFEHGEQP